MAIFVTDVHEQIRRALGDRFAVEGEVGHGAASCIAMSHLPGEKYAGHAPSLYGGRWWLCRGYAIRRHALTQGSIGR